MPANIGDSFQQVMQLVAEAACRSGRDPSEVTVVAVSKGQPAVAVVEAIAAGARIIGENYVQEATAKAPQVAQAAQRLGVKVCWHMIGHLQRNKVRQSLSLFDMIQSLDSPALADVIEREGARQEIVVPALIEVNLAGEVAKSGVSEEELPALVEKLSRCRHTKVEGLMTMPPFGVPAQETRCYFGRLRQLRDDLARPNLELRQLSMGMSADYEVAVEEGATIVRVGQAIFGARKLARRG